MNSKKISNNFKKFLEKTKEFFKIVFSYYYKMEILNMLMLTLIILLLATSIFNFKDFAYFNNYIGVGNIVAAILVLAIFFLRDRKKIKVFLIQSTISINVLVYEGVYYATIYSLLVLNIYTGSLNFFIGLLIILTEAFIGLSIQYKQNKNEIDKEFLKLWDYKEIHYIIMMILLVLQNYPFEMYGIPVTMILSALYIVVNLNIIYKIYE